ncbi:MAG: YceI family protein [Cytophagales bacterium]|nr:YceI family protein [Cytophagales bacterium]
MTNIYNTCVRLGFLPFLALLASCGGGGGGTGAQVGDEGAAAEADAASSRYVLSPEESTFKFVGSNLAGQHEGSFQIAGGDISVGGGTLQAGSITVDIQSLAITSDPEKEKSNKKLADHLLSEDFLSVTEFPEAVFELTAASPLTSEGDSTPDDGSTSSSDQDSGQKADSSETQDSSTHTLSGNLTLRGVTKNISFPATVALQDNLLSIQASFSIDRTHFDIVYGDENAVDAIADKIIHNNVGIAFSLVANLESATSTEDSSTSGESSEDSESEKTTSSTSTKG